MTIELAMFISTIGLLFNTIIIWALGRMSQNQRAITSRLWSRIQYLEVSLAYRGLTPMPWEMEEFDNHNDEIKGFTQEGNVVYLTGVERKDE